MLGGQTQVTSVLWFFFGLGLGLALDWLLVLHMLKPIKRRLNSLEEIEDLKAYDKAMADPSPSIPWEEIKNV